MLQKINKFFSVNLFLLILSVLAISINFDTIKLTYFATTLGTGSIVFFLGTNLFKIKKDYKNTITTLLIIFLLIHPFGIASLWHVALIAFLATSYKLLPRKPYLPYFNPVALTLVLTYAILKLLNLSTPMISWWGASFSGYLSLILIALWITFGITKWRKYPMILSFLATTLLIYLILPQITLSEISYIFTDSTIYFFVAIMLIDPKSSPILKKDQILLGILAAIAYTTFKVLGINNFDLISILIANLLLFLKTRITTAKLRKA